MDNCEIRTRLLATAFLMNEGHVLLMRRARNARLFPGWWAPIGGHLEAGEMNDPRTTCLREIREETGLTGNHLVGLSLRYVVHRQRESEIRTQYVYFGSTRTRNVSSNAEGELCWVQMETAPSLDVSATTRFILEHHLREPRPRDGCIYVGTVDARDGTPIICWAALRDWE